MDEELENLKRLFKEHPTPENEGKLGLYYHKINDYVSAQIHLINSVVEKYDDKVATCLEEILTSMNDENALLGIKILRHENHPKNIQIIRDITILAQKLKHFDIAVEFFEKLLKKEPKDFVAWNNYGLVSEELGDWQKAYECYKKALLLNDFFSPNFNLGIISRKLHRFQDSIKYLKKASLQNPNSPQPKYALSMSYMMLKDFKNGYPLYANHMTKIMPSDYKNEWDGEKQPDKNICVFVKGGVGLGDIIMYSRYLKYLENNFKKIYFLCPKTFHTLFKRSFPYLEILDAKNPFYDYDYAITPMHILKLFDLDFNKFVPDTKGYLKADNNLVQKFKTKYFNNDKIKIGINWHGNREGTRTFFNRSIPIENLEPVFEKLKDKAVFYSVQKDDSHVECQKYPFIVDLYDDINDFDDTAAIMKNLDLLISIDSSPVHLAGALGVKTYMVLPYANEWRWFVGDDKTIWYDTVEIFRQDKEGDWTSAVQKLMMKFE